MRTPCPRDQLRQLRLDVAAAALPRALAAAELATARFAPADAARLYRRAIEAGRESDAPAKLNVVQLHPERSAPAAEDELEVSPQPRRFKVVDVLSGGVLADDVGAPAALRTLRSLRKPVDALVYVHDEDGRRWRLLTLAETSALWALRERA